MELDVQVLKQLASDQQVPLSTVVVKVTDALTDAYGRTPSAVAGAVARLDTAAGTLTITGPDGMDVTPSDFGRLAAAATRQAVTQWLRDVERIRKVGKWAGREGTLISGRVRAHAARNRRGETIFDLGDGVEAVMPTGEATPGEEYPHGTEMTVLIVAVNADDRGGVKITVSRRQPSLVTALFAKVTPELASGQVRIVAIARDPGSRTKVAVTGPGARAALIGPNADRIRQVVAALPGEKVDVLEHHEDLAAYAAAALTPAKIIATEVLDPARKLVRVTVAPDQVALARGKAGANLRLGHRLTGARIEVVPAA